MPLSLTTDLRVQLVKNPSSGPECWESLFTTANAKSSTKQFKDKAP